MRMSVLLALLLAAPAAADGPFADLGFDAAAAKAKEGGKLLLVDFTATWCPPCKMMEKQTWPAEVVGAWITAHAVAIQVDVDKERALAQRFKIQAIPTVVFLRDGEELDRDTGFKDAAALVAWGDAVLAGTSSAKVTAEKGRALIESDDVDARYEAARDALQRGEDELALEHYLWLWPKTREVPSYSGVRVSFMLSDMNRLAERHAPARKAFLGILAELQDEIDEADVPARDDWREWSSMCEHFGEAYRIVAWYERHRDPDGRLFGGGLTGPEGRVIEDVRDALLDQDRAAEAARLYPDLVAAARHVVDEYRTRIESIPVEMRDSVAEALESNCRDELVSLYGLALSDGRTEESDGIATELLALLDDAESRLSLVEAARKHASVLPPHIEIWSREADKLGGPSARRDREDNVLLLLGNDDAKGRLEVANKLLGQGKDAEALEEFMAVWPHWRRATDLGRIPLRRFLPGVAQLAQRHEPARAAFDKLLLDLELDAFATDPPASGAFLDWVEVCEELGKTARVLAWFDQARDEQGRLFGSRFEFEQRYRPDLLEMRAVMERLLTEERRFEDVARLYEDPLRYAQEMSLGMRFSAPMAKGMAGLIVPDDDSADLRSVMDMMRPRFMGHIYAVVLAAGRDVEAEQMAAWLLEDDAGGLCRVALVESVLALDAQRTPQLDTWLDEAEKLGADVSTLRERLARSSR